MEKFLARIAQLHALTHKHKRSLRSVDKSGGLCHRLWICRRARAIRANEVNLHWLIVYHGGLCVFGKIKNHRARTAGICYIESPTHSPGYILCTPNLEAPF